MGMTAVEKVLARTAGRAQVQAGDVAAGRQAFTEGIAAARKTGDNHAASEMEQMLGMLR